MEQEFKLANFEVKEVISSSAGDDYIDWGLKAINAESAWNKTKGKGIKVAILDTGIDADHPDLMQNVREYIDFTGSYYNSEDMQGHGTHCAGIVGGIDNGIGMIGVAPEVELYCAKVLGDNGSGSFDSIIKGIRWAMAQNVDVISMSLGTASKPPEALHEVIKSAINQGIIMVAATGNENGAVCYPAAYDEVIAVSAVDENLRRADFSNYGLQNEITAPGVNVLSTYKKGKYARLSGTSMATPIIAGSLALIIARYKQMYSTKPSVDAAHRQLLMMTKDLGNTGKDDLYGVGIINLDMLP